MIKIAKYKQGDVIFDRTDEQIDVTAIVADIIKDVKENGDKALRKYTEKFDKAKLTELEVSKAEIEEALSVVDSEFIEILKEAAENIRNYHKNQKIDGFEMKGDGIILGQRVMPLATAGIYVPGGTAAYPSTVLMDCIPAKIAGVGTVIMVTPPQADGKVNPDILAAAYVSGVDRIFKVGGAQAVAALAYGTESVPKADKIVGPGNCFVAEAKRQVYGLVDIDMIAGPSEILIIADNKTNPRFAAADMLSQAEHDKLATAVLITDDEDFADAVKEELEKQIPKLLRAEIARASIDNRSKIFVVDNLDEAITLSNEIAPEHLEVCVDNPLEVLDKITNAGSVFLGRNCPEALGDYFAGTNHTLPTSGTAKFSSPLSVYDFLKKSAYTYYDADALRKVSDKIAYFATKEGLTAHAKSATIRFEEEK